MIFKYTTTQYAIFMAVIAVATWWLTASLGWSLASGLALLLGFRLWDDRRLHQWSKQPLAKPSKVSQYWQPAAQRLAHSVAISRNRSRLLVGGIKRLRNTTDVLPDAWVVIEPRGEIEAFNLAAEHLLGLHRNDTGHLITTLIRNPQLDALLRTSNYLDPIELPAPVDQAKQLEFRLIRLDDDRRLLVARNVTEINRLLSMRQDFVANVSHELRTPLTVLLGYIETITHEDLDKKTLNNLIQRLIGPTERMRSLVDDLLMLTQLESSANPDAGTVQAINGKTLLLDVLEDAEQLSDGKHEIELDAQPNLVVEAVPNELHSVFINLVSNAIRYSPGGGKIMIRWFVKNESARFEVQDQGVGIAPDQVRRITERFYRIDMKGSRVAGGTGLGLAIVKHILRRHQSELIVDSKVGKGSLFAFELPFELTQV